MTVAANTIFWFRKEAKVSFNDFFFSFFFLSGVSWSYRWKGFEKGGGTHSHFCLRLVSLDVILVRIFEVLIEIGGTRDVSVVSQDQSSFTENSQVFALFEVR